MSSEFGIGTLLGLSTVQLVVGGALGAWLRQPSPGSAGSVANTDGLRDSIMKELMEQQNQKVQEMDEQMRKLQDLVGSVGANVGQHNSSVQAINAELAHAAHGDTSELQDALLSTVSKVTQANESLQAQLQEAEAKLVEQQKALEKQMAQARTDALTGALNRRAFDDELGRRVAEYHRYRTPVTLMMGDIDYFKKFNDTHGHQAGDQVLKETSKALSKAMRDVDLVCRYGGEEFAIIMPATELTGGGLGAERARLAIEAVTLMFEEQQLHVTMSCGVASAITGEDPSSLVKRADEALYASKRAGRNCTHLHDGSMIVPQSSQAVAKTPDVELSKTVDLLQSLPNRDAFTVELRRRIEQNHRYHTPVSVMICSIDSFSNIRDRQSKELSQQVLREAVQAINLMRRDTDMVARVADDRLAIVLLSSNLTKAVDLAQRIRQTLEQCEVNCEGHDPMQFTVSIGVAEVRHDDDAETIVERATQSLDEAQVAGGNSVQTQDTPEAVPIAATLHAVGGHH